MQRMQELKDILIEDKEREIKLRDRDVQTLQEAWRIDPANLELEAFGFVSHEF